MWEMVKLLGDLCELAYGKPLRMEDRLEESGIPAFGANGKKTYSRKSLYCNPSIVIGRKGSAGELNRVDKPFWALNVSYYVKENKCRIRLDFLFHVLTGLDLPSMAKGIKPGLNRNDVYNRTILLPSLSEQQRIVTKLDTAFAEIDKALDTAKAVEVEIDILRSTPLRSTLDEGAGRWGAVKLFEIADVGSGNPAPQGEESFDNGDQHFVRTSDVGKIHVGFLNSSRDKVNWGGSKKLRLFPKGTVLFPKSGASTLLNYRVMLGMDAYVSSHLATIKAENSRTTDTFIWYFLQTVDASDLVADCAYPSLPTKVIRQIEVPLPPISEQQKIVRKLDNCFAELRKAKEAVQQTQDHFYALKSAILKQELQGEIL